MSEKRLPLFGTVRVLCISAFLCGLSVVIAWICKTYLTFTVLGNGLRITFENLPIFLSALWFGPWVGGAVGAASDLISTAVSSFGINPIITAGAMMGGVAAGCVGRYSVKKPGMGQCFAAVGAGHLIGSGLLKTTGLYVYHYYVEVSVGGISFSSLWLRLPTYLFLTAAEGYACYLLQKNRSLQAQIENLKK